MLELKEQCVGDEGKRKSTSNISTKVGLQKVDDFKQVWHKNRIAYKCSF